MHNPKGGDWGSTKRKQKTKRKKIRRKKNKRNRSLLSCLVEVFQLSKHQMVYAPRSKAKPSMPRVLKRISNGSSKTILRKHVPRWKSLQRHIHPNNWKTKPMICMRNSVRRSRKGPKVGARKVNWIWTISAPWQNKTQSRQYTNGKTWS